MRHKRQTAPSHSIERLGAVFLGIFHCQSS